MFSSVTYDSDSVFSDDSSNLFASVEELYDISYYCKQDFLLPQNFNQIYLTSCFPID